MNNMATTPQENEKTNLQQVDHLRVKLWIFWQRVEDQVVDSPDAVPVEKVRPSRVQQQIAISAEESCA